MAQNALFRRYAPYKSLRLHQTRIIRTKKTIRGSYYFLQEIISVSLSVYNNTSEFASFGRLRFAQLLPSRSVLAVAILFDHLEDELLFFLPRFEFFGRFLRFCSLHDLSLFRHIRVRIH